MNQYDEVIDSISSNNGLFGNISDTDNTSLDRRQLKDQAPITKKAAPVKSYKITRIGNPQTQTSKARAKDLKTSQDSFKIP